MSIIPIRTLVYRAAALASCTARFADVGPPQLSVRMADSVTVADVDGRVGRAGAIALGATGQVFVADVSDPRIFEIGKGGQVVRTYGTKGQGPGEITDPGALTVSGDSLLFVLDYALRRLISYRISSGANNSGVQTTVGRTTIFETPQGIMATLIDPSKFTSLERLTPSGSIAGAEGIVPKIGHTYPILTSVFSRMAVAMRGDDVWAAFELSQSFVHMGKRFDDGSRIPVTRVR